MKFCGDLEEMRLEAGTLIHYRGQPLYLSSYARVLGLAANFVVSKDYRKSISDTVRTEEELKA